ncbi:MAG: hypothetical protein EOO09_17195 [Chitinophagaceae bacterium]|nr:MAG: hypothetical protein EOO09_17195 [Chitinophagaceae bacterium]
MSFREETSLFRRAREAALAYRLPAGVDDLFWAPAIRGGIVTGSLSIRFNVKQKKPASQLRHDELIPRRLGGFPTDVTAFRFSPQVRNELPYDLVRPLMGGVQVQASHADGPADWGTMGIVLQFNSSFYAISNQHVFDRPAWEYGEPFSEGNIIQPKRQAGGGAIAVLSSLGDNRLDYRLARMTMAHDLRQSVNGLPGTVDGYVMPSGIGERKLVKSGASSGVTTGWYEGRSLLEPHRVSIRSVDGSVICKPGDSGSMWLDAGSGLKLFALHCAGDDEGRVAIATLYGSIHASVWQQLKKGKEQQPTI